MNNNPHTNQKPDQEIVKAYHSFIGHKDFPCVAARAAVAGKQVHCLVAGDMNNPDDDRRILQFLYGFVDEFRLTQDLYHSATVIFRQPTGLNEELFDEVLWLRLQALADLDSESYSPDKRVSGNPESPHFSFSIKGEAFFIIALHPNNSRPARRFSYPALVFNPHQQFEILRQQDHYESMKTIVRKRDEKYSGSINPMLDDYGSSSEVLQYSGRRYDKHWKCPLKSRHE